MNLYEFVFSNKKNLRLLRHGLFWLMWALYFFTSYYHYHQVGLQKIQFEELNSPYFLKLLIQLSIHISTCYYFIDFLIPKFYYKKKYKILAWNILALGII